MPPETSRPPAAPAGTFLRENPHTLRMTAPTRRSRRTRGFWALLLVGVALNIGIFALGLSLFLSSGRTVAPSPEQRVRVPFAANATLWQPLRGWVVQEDGRNKPFDTFCRETVRTITGSERFEGNDPVAVVVSWL